MGPSKRKRSQGPNDRPRAPKRKAPVEDEDILSDDADEQTEAIDSPSSPKPGSPSSDSEPENETAEEKRLRLARAYLRHVGVSEDAALNTRDSASDGSEADDVAVDADNALLREQALLQAGKAVTRLADKLAPLLPSATFVARNKGHVQAPTCISMSRHDGLTAVSGGKDSRVLVWDVATQKRTLTFKPTFNKASDAHRNPTRANGHVGAVYSTAVTDDGNIAVSGGADGFIHVWDLRAGKLIAHLRGHRAAVHGLALRAGSRQLFSASHDRTVKIWDLNDMAYVETLFGHGGEVNAIDALTSERALSCGRDGSLRFYKVVDGSQLLFRSSNTISIDTIAMINEQRFVSGGDDGTVSLWQLNKAKATANRRKAHGGSLGCESWISSICAFRNSDVVVSGGGDGMMRFWKCPDVPKLVDIGHVNVGPGFVNGMALDHHHGVMAVAVGNEHRLGRWSRIPGAKNSIKFMSMPAMTQ